MKGETPNPLDIAVAIYNIKFPYEISKIITKFALPIMYCSNCNEILQSDYSKKKALHWIHTDDGILCKKCHPSLGDLYHQRKLTKIE